MSELPPELRTLFIALIIIQLGLMVGSAIRLWRHRHETILGLHSGVWLIIILFGQLLGPIIFLVCLQRHIRDQSARLDFQQHSSDQQPTSSPSKIISALYPRG